MSADTNGNAPRLSLDFPPEFLEAVAQRAAAIVLERQVEQVASGYLDVTGAAEFLACPVSRIYRLTAARRIPFHKDGSRTLFDRQELRDFVRSGGGRTP